MIKAIITTIDNLSNNKEQIRVLKDDPLIDQIIVVNNGSIDSTQKWLSQQNDITVINKENNGAGPGRNSGLDKAGQFDYVLMLDGGIRPLVNGTQRMLEYLGSNQKADVVGVEVSDFETDYQKAWRRWPCVVKNTYRNTRLSHTAYCLARYKAFDGFRFNETGPFAEPGWGCDDDELMYQWNERNIALYIVMNIHPYRRASSSFRRLYQETGIWPNQYGSVYEKRLVWLQQNWPQYEPGIQWGEPWLTLIIQTNAIGIANQLIIEAHSKLRERMFDYPWRDYPNPYSIILDTQNQEVIKWSQDRRLRQFHGDTFIDNGEIVKHRPEEEAKDFRLAQKPRANCHYYAYVKDSNGLSKALKEYNKIWPYQPIKNSPKERREV